MGDRGGGVSNANAGVPAFARKVVKGLKEIVNCSDLEIYMMLVECDMDLDETVNRLISQDTFHEVKSKRDKKKETKGQTKDSAESWTRSIPNRGAKSGGNESYNTAHRSGENRFNWNDTGGVQGVTANRRENGTRSNHWAGSFSTPGVLEHQPPSNSNPTSFEVKKAPTGSDAVTSASLPTPAYQSAWIGANHGQRTMVDIVKMGRPVHQQNVALPRSSDPQESGSKAPLKYEWPSIEKHDVPYQSSSLLKLSAESKMLADQLNESQHLDEAHLDDENPETKTNTIASPPDADMVPRASVSTRNLLDNDCRDSSLYNDESNKDDRIAFEENECEDVSASVATGFQQLAIENEDQELLPKEDKPTLIIPSHLQAHTSECSHLMFGTFGSRIGSIQANGLNDNLEEIQEINNNSSFKHPNTDFYEEKEDQLRNAANDEQKSYQIDSTARDYHASLDSETEAAQHEASQEDHQYKFSSSADYGFENSNQLNPPIESNPRMQNVDTFPNVIQQGYISSLPNSLLPSGIQDAREPNLHYSPFPTKYNTATPSSLSGPAIFMAETLRAASMSPQNAMPSAGQQEASLAQHLSLNPYSQPGMPLGHYGNLITYPYMGQVYNPYMASGFQQAFLAGNHQSLAVMPPQYKPQSTVAPFPPPSAYGFGGGVASSNNFVLNPTNAANSYEDVLSNSHLASSLQQQNENSPAWHQGPQPNLPMVQGSGYYNFPCHQNQLPPDYRQAQQLQQQLSQQQQQQHFGGHGYVSPYHTQAAMSLDHLYHQHHHQQQQNACDVSKQNQQQLWPNNY